MQKHARLSPFSQRLHSSQSAEGFFLLSRGCRLRETAALFLFSGSASRKRRPGNALVRHQRLTRFALRGRLEGIRPLDPNSDEVLVELRYRPTEKFRGRLVYRYVRHGNNVMAADTVARNVGGSVLVGHREGDSETVTFLDGVRSDFGSVLARVDYEPITNFFLAGVVEYRANRTDSGQGNDLFAALQIRLEY